MAEAERPVQSLTEAPGSDHGLQAEAESVRAGGTRGRRVRRTHSGAVAATAPSTRRLNPIRSGAVLAREDGEQGAD